MATTKRKIPVLITTERRGVFFGYIDPETRNERTLQLTGMRNCIRWDASIGGFAKVDGVATMHLVECVLDVAPEAVKAWEAAPCVK